MDQGGDPTRLPGAAYPEEVERLRAEITRLNTEIETLRQNCRTKLDYFHKGRTAAANAARSKRAAELDARVMEVLRTCMTKRYGKVPDSRLWFYGFPEFRSSRYIRHEVAAKLNEAGISAPRGGKWTGRQVLRALVRHAASDDGSLSGNGVLVDPEIDDSGRSRLVTIEQLRDLLEFRSHERVDAWKANKPAVVFQTENEEPEDLGPGQ
jgi:hypothetical protein